MQTNLHTASIIQNYGEVCKFPTTPVFKKARSFDSSSIRFYTTSFNEKWGNLFHCWDHKKSDSGRLSGVHGADMYKPRLGHSYEKKEKTKLLNLWNVPRGNGGIVPSYFSKYFQFKRHNIRNYDIRNKDKLDNYRFRLESTERPLDFDPNFRHAMGSSCKTPKKSFMHFNGLIAFHSLSELFNILETFSCFHRTSLAKAELSSSLFWREG